LDRESKLNDENAKLSSQFEELQSKHKSKCEDVEQLSDVNAQLQKSLDEVKSLFVLRMYLNNQTF
jgi:hypothetical protein